MHKKIAALWVCGLMVISALLIAYSPVTMTAIGAGGTFGGGDGTPGNPYLIEDVLDLQAMNNNKDAHYALASDIDASDTVNWNGGAGFIPIGTDANWFTGSLDGQNFTVTNLYMNHTNINYIGLFGFIGTGSIVKNLHVFELNITGGNYVGGIAGYSMGTIYNAHTSGRIAGLDYVGGLLGQNENGHLNCSHTSIIFHGTHNYVGGLVGNNNGASSIIFGSSVAEKVNGYYNVGGITGNNDYGTIMNSYAAETVVGHQRVGGLVGRNTGVVLNSYALGNTNGTGYVGGLIGDNMIGSVSNSYSWGKVTRTSLLNLNLGAFVGRNYMGMIVNCYSTGSVQYANAADPVDKGFVANVNTGGSYNMTGNFWDIETSGQASTYGNATGKTTAEMKTQSTFTNASWDFANIWWMIENDTYPLLRWMDTEPPASPADLTVVHQGDILFQEALTNCIFMNNYSSWTLTRIQNQGASVWDVAQTATADGSGSATSSLSVNTRNTARAEEAVWTQTFTGISGNITVNAAYRVQTAAIAGTVDYHRASVSVDVYDTGDSTWHMIYSSGLISGNIPWVNFGPDATYIPIEEVNSIRIRTLVEVSTGGGGTLPSAMAQVWIDDISITYPAGYLQDDNLLTWVHDGVAVAQYDIYRSDMMTGPWDLSTYIGNVTVGNNTYLDMGMGLPDGVIWWYVVRARHIVGNEDRNSVTVPEPGGLAPHSIDLVGKSGWVFISFPVDMNGPINEVLNDMKYGDGQTSWDVAKLYDGQTKTWKTHRINSTVNTFTNIDNTVGVWLHLTANSGDQALTLGRYATYPYSVINITLYPGWNMVGYPSMADALASETLPYQADMVAIWKADTPFIQDFTDLSSVTMSHGNAYWIRVTETCIWQI